MKKLILVLALVFMSCNIAFAEMYINTRTGETTHRFGNTYVTPQSNSNRNWSSRWEPQRNQPSNRNNTSHRVGNFIVNSNGTTTYVIK